MVAHVCLLLCLTCLASESGFRPITYFSRQSDWGCCRICLTELPPRYPDLMGTIMRGDPSRSEFIDVLELCAMIDDGDDDDDDDVVNLMYEPSLILFI